MLYSLIVALAVSMPGALPQTEPSVGDLSGPKFPWQPGDAVAYRYSAEWQNVIAPNGQPGRILNYYWKPIQFSIDPRANQ